MGDKNTTGKLFSEAQNKALLTGSVIKLHSAEALLSDPYCDEQLALIKKRLNISPDLWGLMFKPFVEQFALFVQFFPDARSHNKPILFVALTRCATAAASVPTGANDRFRFALFTASLLLNVGIMHTDYRISVVSDKGDFMQEWSPFTGAMFHYADYCRLFPISNVPSRLGPMVTPVLAQTMMDTKGWQWLSEDSGLLLQWLSFLSAADGKGELGAILDLADEKVELEVANMPAAPIESIHIEKNQFGELFWQWVEKHVEEKHFTFNEEDSLIHRTESGLWLDIEAMAAAFAKEHKETSAHEVVAQLEAMGLLKEGKDQYKFEKTESRQVANRKRSALVSSGLFAANAQSAAQNKQSVSTQVQGRLLKDASLLSVGKALSQNVKEVQSPNMANQLNERYKSGGQTLTQQLANREGK